MLRLDLTRLLLTVLILASPLAAQRGEYALILEDPPLSRAAASASKDAPRAAASQNRLARIQSAQQTVRTALADRGIQVTGSSHLLANAIFVRADSRQSESLRALPGVRRVQYLPPVRRQLDRAIELTKVRDAWNRVGEQNAGLGVKIALLDSGIDHTHPAFQDDSLPVPAGFPKGRQEDLAYTNRKIIVARSYVSQLAGSNPATDRPDDTSPRDRVGHGTAAAMIAAGVRVTGPAGTIQGVAPKAYLGNYKIFGSPGVNDTTFFSVLIAALEDAINDGMDIAVLPVGGPAVYGPLDRDAQFCGGDDPLGLDVPNDACDIRAYAVENATKLNLTVVVAGGNDGDAGLEFPTLNSVHTPGTAPSAITVGATTNSHVFFAAVRDDGRRRNALFGDGPKPSPTLTAPLRDVSQFQDNGEACSPLANGSLDGVIALIQRGTCAFATKVNNAQKAGAVGVVIYQSEGNDFPFAPLGLVETGIPATMIGYSDGIELKNILRSSPDKPVTLDPSLQAFNAEFDTVADFSSQGPSIGNNGIKPELVAVGTDLYTATQKYDPNGELYDASGFTATQGTSFAAPMVAGAAAMVKQQHPGFGPSQLKSAVVNTASNEVKDYQGATAGVLAVGAGKLNAGAAVATNLTVSPSVLSFGTTTGSKALVVTNHGSTPISVGVTVVPREIKAGVTVTASTSQIPSLPAGNSATVTIQLQSQGASPGVYEGYVTIGDLRVPYLYLVGDGQPFNAFALQGQGFTGIVGEQNFLMTLKVIDRYGVPVPNVPIRFAVPPGGSIYRADERTDILGIAAADVDLGTTVGEQTFTAEVNNDPSFIVYFDGIARMQPTIASNGVQNGASFEADTQLPLAPGSYITIKGSALSDSTRVFNTPYLPISLAGVSVSFDNTDAKLSLPGHIHYVSEKQINVQVPWEFQGLRSVKMKVSIGWSSSALYEVELADYSPAAFEFLDVSGRLLAAVVDEQGVVTMANPAARGRVVSIYANGLGPLDAQPRSGEATPDDRLHTVRALPTVSIGGRPAHVDWAGLAPNYVGLYQINVWVPGDAPTGLQPVVITSNGITSKSAQMPIE